MYQKQLMCFMNASEETRKIRNPRATILKKIKEQNPASSKGPREVWNR